MKNIQLSIDMNAKTLKNIIICFFLKIREWQSVFKD